MKRLAPGRDSQVSAVLRIAALVVALACATGPAAAADIAAPTLDELFKRPRVFDAALSPDGKRVAMAYTNGEKGGDVIMIVDCERLGAAEAVRHFSMYETGRLDIRWVNWANDTRLLIGARIRSDDELKEFDSKPLIHVELPFSRRVIAIDPDGGNLQVLFSDSKTLGRRNFNLSKVVDYTADDPQHVLMAAWSGSSNDLYEVDVSTGAARVVARGRASTIGWEAEDGKAVLRYDSNARGTVISVFGRDNEDEQKWSQIVRYRLKDDVQDWMYAGDAPGAGKIYVRMRREGVDTDSIYLFDIPSKTFGEMVAQVPGYDMRYALLIDGKYAGATYIGDRLTYVFKDPKLQKHFDALVKFFRGSANVVITGLNQAHTRMLIYAQGPQAPGDYYVYDVAKAHLDFLESARPWLKPEQLAKVEILRSPMRDGAAITSYLTRPRDLKGPLPLVVMPHGGPEARDSVEFDPMVQALAAQGWLVLQPNFRGSGGYGRAFAEAGYRQWSRRMQDDVTDSVKDLVDRGIADPRRIAIFGASYGGFAALSGAFVTPDLYRAAVSLAGIGDLAAMVKHDCNEDGDDAESCIYWKRSIGDPKRDAADLKAASPEYNVQSIRIPVLLMHGSDDTNVPVQQSRKMKKALEKAGKTVRYVEFAGEDHSGWSPENNVKMMGEAIAFLKPVLESSPPP